MNMCASKRQKKEVMQAELLPIVFKAQKKKNGRCINLAGRNNAHADEHLRLHSNINPEAIQNEHF